MKIVSQTDFRNNIADMMKAVCKSGEPITIFGKDDYSVVLFPAKDIGLQKPEGNLFNADRDNNGKGIPVADMKKMLGVS